MFFSGLKQTFACENGKQYTEIGHFRDVMRARYPHLTLTGFRWG